jgi:uncharacterized protein (DUF1330 family)
LFRYLQQLNPKHSPKPNHSAQNCFLRGNAPRNQAAKHLANTALALSLDNARPRREHALLHQPEDAMTKAYWIAHVTVTEPAAYDLYRAANAAPLARFGAKFLVRAGAQTVVEGTIRARTVVIEFPNLQAATDCYNSPDYQAALALRKPASEGDICIIEGWAG